MAGACVSDDGSMYELNNNNLTTLQYQSELSWTLDNINNRVMVKDIDITINYPININTSSSVIVHEEVANINGFDEFDSITGVTTNNVDNNLQHIKSLHNVSTRFNLTDYEPSYMREYYNISDLLNVVGNYSLTLDFTTLLHNSIRKVIDANGTIELLDKDGNSVYIQRDVYNGLYNSDVLDYIQSELGLNATGEHKLNIQSLIELNSIPIEINEYNFKVIDEYELNSFCLSIPMCDVNIFDLLTSDKNMENSIYKEKILQFSLRFNVTKMNMFPINFIQSNNNKYIPDEEFISETINYQVIIDGFDDEVYNNIKDIKQIDLLFY